MLAEKIYHIYTHANGSENLFRSEENYRYFLQRYLAYIPGVADTLVFCLMPNHLHLLVRIKCEEVLRKFFLEKRKGQFRVKQVRQSRTKYETKLALEKLTILQFSHLFNAYSKAYNKAYQRKGSLFIRAFRRKEITSENYLTTVIRYIHNNPVHHNFVKKITDWTWSSYPEYLLPHLSAVHEEVIEWFGGRQQFILFHQGTDRD